MACEKSGPLGFAVSSATSLLHVGSEFYQLRGSRCSPPPDQCRASTHIARSCRAQLASVSEVEAPRWLDPSASAPCAAARPGPAEGLRANGGSAAEIRRSSGYTIATMDHGGVKPPHSRTPHVPGHMCASRWCCTRGCINGPATVMVALPQKTYPLPCDSLHARRTT